MGPCCNPALLAEKMKKEIELDKSLRAELDAILQKLKNGMNDQCCHSEERIIASQKIREAIMWLGMDLKRIGTPDPYPTSKDPEDPTIHPTSDGLKM